MPLARIEPDPEEFPFQGFVPHEVIGLEIGPVLVPGQDQVGFVVQGFQALGLGQEDQVGDTGVFQPGQDLVLIITARAEAPGQGSAELELKADFLAKPYRAEEPTNVF